MKTLEERLEIVRKIARKLIKKYALQPPIDVEKIATQEGIAVQYKGNQWGIDGYANLDTNTPSITVNAEQTYLPRTRFTLAHEIGHIQIPWHADIDGCVTDNPYVFIQKQRKIDSQELEANTFASELLIPCAWLQKAIAEERSFQALLDRIVRETNASVMACLYALENALPSGNIFFITTDSMDYWKMFRTANTFTWRGGYQDRFQFLDKICLRREVFSRGNYTICYYQLLPCPELDQVNGIYENCDNDLGTLLNALTNYQPERIFHCLNMVLSKLSDRFYVFLETYGDAGLAHYRSPDCQIRVPSDITEYNQLKHWIEESYVICDELVFSGNKRLYWIKESQYVEPAYCTADSKELLKELTSEYYSPEEAKDVLFHINGVIGNMNRTNESDRAVLYRRLKARFSQDQYVRSMITDPRFNQFLSNRITEIIQRRRVK